MENAHLTLFICIAAPLSMMIFIFKKQAKTILVFLLIGFFMCLFASEINGMINNSFDLDMRYMTVNITPIIEEILKAIPIIIFSFLFKKNRLLVMENAIAVGVGFATMENMFLIMDSSYLLSNTLILARGFGAGMMHAVSSLAVGYSMVLTNQNEKYHYTGTIAAISVAIIYHSIYNIMVQSIYPMLGILLPIITYIPLLIIVLNIKKQKISN